jgi:isopentenyldiphosphate isomerase
MSMSDVQREIEEKPDKFAPWFKNILERMGEF